MNRIAVASAATVFALAAVVSAPDAEARRGGFGWGGGLVAAAVIGGIAAAVIASRHRNRSYAYYPRQTYYSSAYYAPRFHGRHRRW